MQTFTYWKKKIKSSFLEHGHLLLGKQKPDSDQLHWAEHILLLKKGSRLLLIYFFQKRSLNHCEWFNKVLKISLEKKLIYKMCTLQILN